MADCRVFNIERFATEDGHGIRTVVFLKGCGLRCKWCANPESQSPRPQILVKNNVCTGCGRCQAICPSHAIHYQKEFGFITDQSACTLCGACIGGCYADARELMGADWRAGDLLKEILKDEQYFKMSGGGVTFSGGEPLLYYPVIADVARQMRQKGYNTLIETCGQAPLEAFEAVCEAVEYIYYDVKQMDPAKHRELTGVDNSLILDNLEWLSRHYKGHLAVRYPYIPGCNGDEESIRKFFEYIKGLEGIKEIIFLPYHRLGYPKYQGLGREYEMGDMTSLKKSDLAFLIEKARPYGLEIKIQ